MTFCTYMKSVNTEGNVVFAGFSKE